MWIRVRSMDGKICVSLENVSKLTKIEEIREKLVPHLKVESGRQRLFYRGKQMEDGHTLFDYNVNINDLIQVLIKPVLTETQNFTRATNNETERTDKPSPNKNSGVCEESTHQKEESTVEKKEFCVNESDYYKVGDQVDVWDSETGSWYESKIIKIVRDNSGVQDIRDKKYDMDETNNNIEKVHVDNTLLDSNGRVEKKAKDGYIYYVLFQGYEEPSEVNVGIIRPRSWKKLKFEDISVGDEVLANYYVDEPRERGLWYDVKITEKTDTRTNKQLIAIVNIGKEEVPLENCKLMFLNEIFKIETPVAISERDEEMDYWMQTGNIPTRISRPNCEHCKDKASAKCKWCACNICGGKDNPSKQLLCDECDHAFHLWCLDPPLETLPEDDWYCPDCKNDDTEVVKAGERLKESKKKAKMASALGSCSRDWGKGMACVGRTKQCTIVPSNHFGPIPGIEVGTMWKFRVQASEAGVHRPHVAGIHGRENEGAYSIVLAGGYEDDVDNGEEFTYTGSGGRDLSGNKRTAQQSCDQRLTRMNRALALNCNASVNAVDGAVAKNWQGGKPVRVLRSAKGRKESKYCPEDGLRYDGIYKIVKYWPERGKSGYIVWRYLLRRDDPVTAPWTKAGLNRIRKLGLVMQYPDGYLETLALKECSYKVTNSLTDVNKKRSLKDIGDDFNSGKRQKQTTFELPSAVKMLIKKDINNEHLWKECLQNVDNGHSQFISKVEELFMCVCCQDLVYKPITTECNHNVCQACLSKSFTVAIYSCPVCRFSLGEHYTMIVNKFLEEILSTLFPGYEHGR